jgi:hypothetical protein
MTWFLVGFLFGGLMALNWVEDRKQRDLSKLDPQLRHDLEVSRNLNHSLMEDVAFWRDRYNSLKRAKEKT